VVATGSEETYIPASITDDGAIFTLALGKSSSPLLPALSSGGGRHHAVTSAGGEASSVLAAALNDVRALAEKIERQWIHHETFDASGSASYR